MKAALAVLFAALVLCSPAEAQDKSVRREKSAALLEEIYADAVTHVAAGVKWLARLCAPACPPDAAESAAPAGEPGALAAQPRAAACCRRGASHERAGESVAERYRGH